MEATMSHRHDIRRNALRRRISPSRANRSPCSDHPGRIAPSSSRTQSARHLTPASVHERAVHASPAAVCRRTDLCCPSRRSRAGSRRETGRTRAGGPHVVGPGVLTSNILPDDHGRVHRGSKRYVAAIAPLYTMCLPHADVCA